MRNGFPMFMHIYMRSSLKVWAVLIKQFRKVTPVLSHNEDLNELQKDDRRNLYVLGLPFSLTKWVTYLCQHILSDCGQEPSYSIYSPATGLSRIALFWPPWTIRRAVGASWSCLVIERRSKLWMPLLARSSSKDTNHLRLILSHTFLGDTLLTYHGLLFSDHKVNNDKIL